MSTVMRIFSHGQKLPWSKIFMDHIKVQRQFWYHLDSLQLARFWNIIFYTYLQLVYAYLTGGRHCECVRLMWIFINWILVDNKSPTSRPQVPPGLTFSLSLIQNSSFALSSLIFHILHYPFQVHVSVSSFFPSLRTKAEWQIDGTIKPSIRRALHSVLGHCEG